MKTLLFLTGHTKGLGSAILEKFLSEEGVSIMAISRSTLGIDHPKLREIALDLSDLEALKAQLPKLFPTEPFDRFILINNAGWIGEVRPIGRLNPQVIQQVINLNLVAPMILTDAFVKAYRAQSGQKIICNISSGAAHKPLSGWGEYCTSKAGLAMFSKVANEELKGQGFRVFSLAPGIVDTAMQSEIRQADRSDFPALDRFVGYKEDGKLSTPVEVAGKIFHLIQHPDLFQEVIQDVRDF